MHFFTKLAVIGAVASLGFLSCANAHVFGQFHDPYSPPRFIAPKTEVSYSPGLNMYEKEDKFFIEAPLPGVSEKDVTLTLESSVLLIKGQREIKDSTGSNISTAASSFAYSIRVPKNADVEHPEASLKNGLMTVVFNKRKEAQSRKIEFTY